MTLTKNAQLIYDIIHSSESHFTTEEIYIKIKEQKSKMVLATVYNNLNSLLEHGLIRKVTVEGYPDRYDRIVRHDHLLCAKCGRLVDINLKDLTNVLKDQINIDILSYDLKVSYICSSCKTGE